MKKLLAILAATGLSASASASVTACVVGKVTANALTDFLGDIARASYLNSMYGYDMDFIIQSNLYEDNKDGRNILERSFGGQLFAEDITLNNVSLDRGILPEDGETLINFFSIASDIMELDSSKNKTEQIKTLITNSLSLFGIKIDSESIKNSQEELNSIGTTLQNIGSSLDMNKYVGKNWNEAMQISLTNWAKAISANAGTSIEAKTDFVEIMDAMSSSLDGNFDFGYLINSDYAITSLVDFIKLVLLYISHFIAENDINSVVEIQNIATFRNKTIQMDDSEKLDIKTLFQSLNNSLFGENNTTTGPIALQNILAALLIDTSKTYVTVNEDNATDLLFSDKEESYGNFIHNPNSNLGIGKFVASLLNSAINLDIGGVAAFFPIVNNLGNALVNILEVVASGTQLILRAELEAIIKIVAVLMEIPTEVLSLLDGVVDLLSSEQPLALMWNQDVLGPLLTLLLGIRGNFSFVGIFNSSLSDLFGLENILGFRLTGDFSSIKGIIGAVANNVGSTNTVLDIDKLGNVLEQVGIVLQDLPSTVDEIVTQLNTKTSTQKQSAIDDLFDLVNSGRGLKNLFTYLGNIVETQQAEFLRKTITDFRSLNVVAIVENNRYIFTVGQRRVVISTVNDGRYLRISSISVI